MAKVQLIDTSIIELFRGQLDIYNWKGKIWVVRKWPKKLQPPYTELQSTFQDVFRCSKQVHIFFSPVVIEDWKRYSGGSYPNWQDQIPEIFMSYYKLYSILVPVVVDYDIEVGVGKKRVLFKVWSGYDFNFNGGTVKERVSEWFTDEYILSFQGSILVSLFDDSGLRVCCPWILLKN